MTASISKDNSHKKKAGCIDLSSDGAGRVKRDNALSSAPHSVSSARNSARSLWHMNNKLRGAHWALTPELGEDQETHWGRSQKISANCLCTKFFEISSGHGRPCRKSWTSAPQLKMRFRADAVIGDKLFHPWPTILAPSKEVPRPRPGKVPKRASESTSPKCRYRWPRKVPKEVLRIPHLCPKDPSVLFLVRSPIP